MNMSRKKNRSKPRYKLLPRDTIQAATQGEPDAVATVLRHYEGYIAKLSTRCLFDEYGNTYPFPVPPACGPGHFKERLVNYGRGNRHSGKGQNLPHY